MVESNRSRGNSCLLGEEIVSEETPQPKPAPTATTPSEAKTLSTPSAAAPHASPSAAPKKKKADGILIKKPGQWICLVKDEKGKNCEGKLKRFYDLDEAVIRQVGENAELYRCIKCYSLYRPENPAHDPAARWAEV